MRKDYRLGSPFLGSPPKQTGSAKLGDLPSVLDYSLGTVGMFSGASPPLPGTPHPAQLPTKRALRNAPSDPIAAQAGRVRPNQSLRMDGSFRLFSRDSPGSDVLHWLAAGQDASCFSTPCSCAQPRRGCGGGQRGVVGIKSVEWEAGGFGAT